MEDNSHKREREEDDDDQGTPSAKASRQMGDADSGVARAATTSEDAPITPIPARKAPPPESAAPVATAAVAAPPRTLANDLSQGQDDQQHQQPRSDAHQNVQQQSQIKERQRQIEELQQAADRARREADSALLEANSLRRQNHNPAITIYVLRLEGNKYYVGKTRKNVHERFGEHQRGRAAGGAAWTSRHPPRSLLEWHPQNGLYDVFSSYSPGAIETRKLPMNVATNYTTLHGQLDLGELLPSSFLLHYYIII